MSPILNKTTPNRSSTSKRPEKWLSVRVFRVLKIHLLWQDLEHLQLFQRNFDPTIIHIIYHLEMPKILWKTVPWLAKGKKKWWWVVVFSHRMFSQESLNSYVFSFWSLFSCGWTIDCWFILELYCMFTINTIELFFYFKGFGFAVLFLSQMREYLGVLP